MAKVEKIELGALKVTDKGRMDRNEIVAELLDRMQKYVAEVENLARDTSVTLEERYKGVQCIGSRCAGLGEFLNCSLMIEVRDPATGLLCTQKMCSRIFYYEQMLSIELARAGRK